jgi:hypothetical protein
MNLKNYTSGVAVEQTIARIESRLASIGANSITKHYSPDRRIAAILFVIELGDRCYSIRLPANADACFDAMWKEHCKRSARIHPSAKERIKDQALRTAWKLVQDWVDVQVSLIVMQQAEWLQVFMSYVYDPQSQQTFYELAKGGGFKQLPWNPGKEESLNSGDLLQAMGAGNPSR